MNIDQVIAGFDRRYRTKKILNIAISALIVLCGIFSVYFIFKFDKEGLLTFRWMTVDGTIFTTILTSAFIIINIIEITRKTELTRSLVYFIRLSSSVAESLILIVVLLSQLPFFSQHMHILRIDMFFMHLLIPLLTIFSFVLNDSPLGLLSFRQLWNGTAFVTVYAAIIIALIQGNVIASDKIPYFFLDFDNMPLLMIILGFIFIYAISFGMAKLLVFFNRRYYWMWFRLTSKKSRAE